MLKAVLVIVSTDVTINLGIVWFLFKAVWWEMRREERATKKGVDGVTKFQRGE